MKKPKDIEELANRLTGASAMPLVPAAGTSEITPAPNITRRKAPNRRSVSVFLRMPEDMYAQYDAEAVNRTKETGRGVTVQQVILDKLAGQA